MPSKTGFNADQNDGILNKNSLIVEGTNGAVPGTDIKRVVKGGDSTIIVDTNEDVYVNTYKEIVEQRYFNNSEGNVSAGYADGSNNYINVVSSANRLAFSEDDFQITEISTGIAKISSIGGGGANGATGATGISGFSGITGATGFSGYSGAAGAGGVISLNGLTGVLSLVAGSNVSITPSGSNITIESSGGNIITPDVINEDSIGITVKTGNVTGNSNFSVGDLNLIAGSGDGSYPGRVVIRSGNVENGGGINAGAVSIRAGEARGAGSGGTIEIYAGQAFAGAGAGRIDIRGGQATFGATSAGTVSVQGGQSTTAGVAGGNITIEGGQTTGSSTRGGHAFVVGGQATGSGSNGGNVYIRGGQATSGGANGNVIIGDSDTSTIVMSSPMSTRGTYEALSTINGATGTVVNNFSNGALFNYTNIAANFTVNVTNLNLSSNNATNIILVLNQGATAYVPTALQIGGVAQTINWQGGAQPAGNANKKDIISFSVTNVGGTYLVLGQLVSFG